MIKNIIFDLDGTIAHTAKDIIFSLSYSLKKKGFRKFISFHDFKGAANKGSIEMIKKFIKKNDTNLIKDINQVFINHYRNNICIKSKLKSNVLSFLNECKKKKIKLFISTNKSEENAKLILKKLKIIKLFNFIAGNNTFPHRKPNPLHLQMLKKKFSLKKNETIFIGDSEIDSTLAKKFKIKFILIKNGYTLIKHTKIKADFLVTNFAEIPKILEKLS